MLSQIVHVTGGPCGNVLSVTIMEMLLLCCGLSLTACSSHPVWHPVHVTVPRHWRNRQVQEDHRFPVLRTAVLSGVDTIVYPQSLCHCVLWLTVRWRRSRRRWLHRRRESRSFGRVMMCCRCFSRTASRNGAIRRCSSWVVRRKWKDWESFIYKWE